MMSLYSKKIYGLMMSELSIMGPYQIDRVCKTVDVNPYLITEKDLPRLAKELSRVVLAYKGPERAKSFAEKFEMLHDMDTLIAGERNTDRRIEYLLNLGDLQRLIGGWDRAQKYYLDVLDISTEKEKYLFLCKANRKLGSMHAMLSDFQKSSEFLTQAQENTQNFRNKKEKARLRREWAYLDWRQGRLESSLKHIEEALHLLENGKNERLIGELMIRRSSVLTDMGRQDDAIDELKSAISILERNNDILNLSRAYNNMGVIFKYQNKYEEAIENYKHSLKAANETESPRAKAYPLANSAECYVKIGDIETARRNAEEATNIFISLGERFMLARLKIVDALLLDADGNQEEAEKSLLQGLEAFEDLDIPSDYAWELYEAGLLFKKWKRKEAHTYFDKAAKTFQKIGNKAMADIVNKSR